MQIDIDYEKDYPHAVRLTRNFKDLRPVGKWCMENIGENAYLGDDLSTTTYSANEKWVFMKGYFRFKHEKDAFLFKMTWG